MLVLTKLTEDNITALKNKTVYCVEKSKAYMEELLEKFDLSDSNVFIVDDNKRGGDCIVAGGREITVCGTDRLIRSEWDKTVILITSDYYREIYEKLVSLLDEQVDLHTVYYFVNKETEYEEFYRRKYANVPLENIIVFRSGPHASSYVKGMDFGDNARALFEYMLETGIHHKYRLVWLVKNPDDFAEYKAYENVTFLSYNWSVAQNQENRDAYYYALCLAKYLFFTDAYGFARNCRKDQTRVQLWHGCGYKNRVNFSRCEKRYEYTTVISELYADVYAGAFGLRRDQMLVTGYAKQDWLFHPVSDLCGEVGIPHFDKYIFWLPTFRMARQGLANLNEYAYDNQTGLPVIGTLEELEELNRLLSEGHAGMVIKLHPFQDRSKVLDIHFSNIILLDNDILVEKDIQINRLLGHANALISDYSSAAVDYMLLDRPIAFTLDDVEEYGKSRGFFFDNIHDWLPGKELYTFDEFCGFVGEVIAGIDSTRDKRNRLCRTMHKYHDDHNCQRILETFGIAYR